MTVTDPLAAVSTRRTPQNEQADPRQVQNSAGGFTFTVSDETRLRRFLTLGVEGGTFYVKQADLTRDNAAVVMRMVRKDPATVVRTVVEVSQGGLAPKQNPALFTLAACAALATDAGRREALDVLPLVARTGTHLFLFARYVEQFRGWGRGLRRAVARWYLDKPVEDVAYQIAKYSQREGWSHRDLLRLAHPQTEDPARRALFDWTCGRPVPSDLLPPVVNGVALAREDSADYSSLVREYPLSWEMLPDAALNQASTWDALLDSGRVPQTALMRQLPRLTRLGVLGPMSLRTTQVAALLRDEERLRRGRVHPISVLLALRTYASGRSVAGESAWTPVPQIIDALDAAFYAAFRSVEPTGKRTMLALDVSGSMMSSAGGTALSCREVSAALALVTAATEPNHVIVGFTSSGGGWSPWSRQGATALTPLAISPRQRLDDAVRAVSELPFGATDCALPMLHALKTGLAVDTFVIFTDNETWAGNVHPYQALRTYREKTGIPARLAVVGMTSTGISIADPTDAGMLDFAGFDASLPTLLSEFSRGL